MRPFGNETGRTGLSPSSRKKEGFFMIENDDLTSAGVPWSEVPEFARHTVAWIDGRHEPAQRHYPDMDTVLVLEILSKLSHLHEKRPRGSKAMLDAAGTRARLRDLRPSAWLISPSTGWKWAKWPNGEVGWLPADIELPANLRVPARNDFH
jgi:hypothetical protein